MLRYEFLYKTEEGLVFSYFPENSTENPGRVLLTEKGVGRIIAEAKDDFGKRYAIHAIKGIDITQKSGVVAWY